MAARDPERDRALRERFGGIANLRMTGVLDQFATPEWGEVLGRSWILVNSSAREGLPTAFIEAAAHRCGILSFTDPDGFATRFGHRATEGRLEEGLRDLLRNDGWRELGEAGRRYVERVFSIEHSMDEHLRAYETALTRRRRAKMTAEPEVTVVVTTHDRRVWLERCVVSVLDQRGVTLQLVIVDDASSDGTSEWLGMLDDERVTANLAATEQRPSAPPEPRPRSRRAAGS